MQIKTDFLPFSSKTSFFTAQNLHMSVFCSTFAAAKVVWVYNPVQKQS